LRDKKVCMRAFIWNWSESTTVLNLKSSIIDGESTLSVFSSASIFRRSFTSLTIEYPWTLHLNFRPCFRSRAISEFETNNWLEWKLRKSNMFQPINYSIRESCCRTPIHYILLGSQVLDTRLYTWWNRGEPTCHIMAQNMLCKLF